MIHDITLLATTSLTGLLFVGVVIGLNNTHSQ